jgi:putative alpha-1,2-mannosidase
VLNWATKEELAALTVRIEANHQAQLKATEDALQTILARIGEVEEQIESQPKAEPKPTEPLNTSGGFVPFSARKRAYVLANRKDLTVKK